MSFRGWISRAAHDEIVRHLESRATSAEAALAALDIRHQAAYQDLLTRYQSLVERRASADGVPDKPVALESSVDLVLQAAYEQWGAMPGAMQYVVSYITEQRAKRGRGEIDALSEADLMYAVIHGISQNDGVGS